MVKAPVKATKLADESEPPVEPEVPVEPETEEGEVAPLNFVYVLYTRVAFPVATAPVYNVLNTTTNTIVPSTNGAYTTWLAGNPAGPGPRPSVAPVT